MNDDLEEIKKIILALMYNDERYCTFKYAPLYNTNIGIDEMAIIFHVTKGHKDKYIAFLEESGRIYLSDWW